MRARKLLYSEVRHSLAATPILVVKLRVTQKSSQKNIMWPCQLPMTKKSLPLLGERTTSMSSGPDNSNTKHYICLCGVPPQMFMVLKILEQNSVRWRSERLATTATTLRPHMTVASTNQVTLPSLLIAVER